jgi:hypothetical protein
MSNAMPLSDYLRQQAATCQRLSRATFAWPPRSGCASWPPTLRAKAEAVEDDGEDVRLHMMQGNGFAGSNGESSPD